ncbi:MAG TPA: peptidoglycan DD-metalloendopeptidase family protein [Casimicrobiaceae bacterium]|jgi:lipoprotein NlpD|nr:peptidoglycan DD-metalloendopeptidase family protein [Casimicrobiaceae bacterium]
MTHFGFAHSCRLLAPVAAALLLASCMTRPPAPVSERAAPPPETIEGAPPGAPAPPPETPPPTHIVKRGETLYQIALDHGLDYRELAAWNNIENINVIRVGRALVLAPPGEAGAAATAPGGAVTTPLPAAPPIAPVGGETRTLPFTGAAPSGRGNTAAYKSEPKALKLPYSEQALAQMQQSSAAAPPAPPVVAPPAPAAAAPSAGAPSATPPPGTVAAAPARIESARVPEIDGGNIDWAWPAAGKVISGFSETANLKGIDIAGKSGQPVLASGPGKVVYAGNGLRGYGKLIIIKHNNTFLSAYAHNREILVKEGQQVARGQKIAEMGDSDADQVKLHFEIRRLGKPVDPAKFLPPA